MGMRRQSRASQVGRHIVNRKKDGSIIWVDFLVNGAFDANEKLTSILCFPST
jgi:aminopeptidase-like protein